MLPLQGRLEEVTDDSDLLEVYNTEGHLLYVAYTRVRDRLLVTAARVGSEFLGGKGRGGMNAFEELIGSLMERENYWVRTSYKVNLTKQEKVAIGKPSSPRWELDLIAYKPGSHDLRVIECKSYLDSRGVCARDFNPHGSFGAKRYKLFNDQTLRDVVLRRTVAQLVESGMCPPEPRVTLSLAVGRFATPGDEAQLRTHFSANGWELLTEEWIASGLRDLSKSGYENSTASIVAKLLR